jgi:hypothetical protein
MVRLWSLSVTGVLFEKPPDGVGPVFARFLDELQEALAEPFGKVLHLFQDRGEKLALIGTHGSGTKG